MMAKFPATQHGHASTFGFSRANGKSSRVPLIKIKGL
jgi:hypothetical protein